LLFCCCFCGTKNKTTLTRNLKFKHRNRVYLCINIQIRSQRARGEDKQVFCCYSEREEEDEGFQQHNIICNCEYTPQRVLRKMTVCFSEEELGCLAPTFSSSGFISLPGWEINFETGSCHAISCTARDSQCTLSLSLYVPVVCIYLGHTAYYLLSLPQRTPPFIFRKTGFAKIELRRRPFCSKLFKFASETLHTHKSILAK